MSMMRQSHNCMLRLGLLVLVGITIVAAMAMLPSFYQRVDGRVLVGDMGNGQSKKRLARVLRYGKNHLRI